MNISDEKLSAFLDAELPEGEMDFIREQLIENEELTNRLAELAMVDELVAASYSTIDRHPLPDSITNLLMEKSGEREAQVLNKQNIAGDNFAKQTPDTAKIIAFPVVQKFQNALQKHIAIAAGVVMVLGLGAIQLLHDNNNASGWQNVATLLDTAPSGIMQVAENGVAVKPRLTFTNKEGDYCRQFDMTDKKLTTENIACRKAGQWKIVVSVTLDQPQETGAYQTASGGSLLDAAVEDMADGDFLDSQAESSLIEKKWTTKK